MNIKIRQALVNNDTYESWFGVVQVISLNVSTPALQQTRTLQESGANAHSKSNITQGKTGSTKNHIMSYTEKIYCIRIVFYKSNDIKYTLK